LALLCFGAKAARKMLMKLTNGRNSHQSLAQTGKKENLGHYINPKFKPKFKVP